jgi:hypothetical protein
MTMLSSKALRQRTDPEILGEIRFRQEDLNVSRDLGFFKTNVPEVSVIR